MSSPPNSSADPQLLRRRAVQLSVAVGFLMLVMKMGGYLITGSAAILSDAMESVVHVIATGVALYSIILIGRPADRRYPYGYGKVEYFSAGLEGALIIIAAIAIVYEATADILRGPEVKDLDIGVLVVAAAGLINLALGFHLVRTGKRTRSLVLVADGKHVLTDSYTSIGVLVGLLLVRFTGVVLLDPIFAVLVALNILWTGSHLIRESFTGLMNMADLETLERTVEVMNRIRTPEMIDMHRLRAWKAGERRFIDFHLTLPDYMRLDQTHRLQETIHDALSNEFHGEVDVMLHLDPCIPRCCHFCGKEECDARHDPQEISRDFTVADAQGEPAHRRLSTTVVESEGVSGL